jgi:RNA polymerase sigma factor (sigma-70 family)
MVDREHFASYVAPYIDDMARIAKALVGEDAEDAAQESLERAWTARGQLRDPQSARSWLLHITVNVCRNWWKGRYGTHQRTRADLTDAALLGIGLFDPGSSDAAAALDLREAIRNLPDIDRLIVVLRYYVGLDATEIGVTLTLPSATIRTRLRRALEQLHGMLDGKTQTAKGGTHASRS